MQPELETDRLRLRAFVEDDLDAYARICGDALTMRFIGEGKPYARSEAWRSLAFLLGHWELRGYGMWAVEEKTTGKFVGRLGLHKPEGWPVLEVGWLIDRERWGEGLAPEGGAAAIQFAFEQLNVGHISSLIFPQNWASIRVAEKLGMTFERPTTVNGIEVLIYGRDR